ncbi:hypothetical protein VOLCADRAFT_98379 [Volvox carteri f. nagariensis]|uniref:Uncharacterized protein n=1 Tax=Volvox carteri f. nagariensis TaxID=3068 RepID=D8UF68_VOLCA|nr:uncharacterized protein VOLCADRAFT_98379 [Volvox carteri f. nagariensis]EFJ41665.1 hypothetical protein VOLCADRAFT_98379 [Volvox carteri f. nagariensis]|eukprot:XP_002957321.1 hypothetical protein VOLCADRAFT_98379 [Volvox carteri f. nagariensis]
MKALSLHGPWAYYERKSAENERRIADLEQEVLRWKSQHDELQHKVEYLEAERKQLQGVQLPGLLAEKGRSQGIIDNLQAELARERLERADEHRQLTVEVSSLTQELQKLSADNAVLRSELAKTVHQKQLTSTKLEQIRKKLGLSESEAKAFIQVAELRMQLQKQQGEIWQAKTEQQTALAAARQLQQQQQPGSGRRSSQLVMREWSVPGELGSGAAAGERPAAALAAGRTGTCGVTACASTGSVGVASVASERRAGGKQNRPPWSDASRGKGAAAASTAGVAKPVVHVPVSVKPLGPTDAAKAGIIRQALAARNQRLGFTQQQQQQQEA